MVYFVQNNILKYATKLEIRHECIYKLCDKPIKNLQVYTKTKFSFCLLVWHLICLSHLITTCVWHKMTTKRLQEISSCIATKSNMKSFNFPLASLCKLYLDRSDTIDGVNFLIANCIREWQVLVLVNRDSKMILFS